MLQKILTIISSLSTIALTFFAWQTLRENKRLRGISDRPYLLFHLEASSKGLIQLCIENVGDGPALDIILEIKEPEDIDKYDLSEFGFDRIPRFWPMIRAGGILRFGIARGFDLSQTKEEKNKNVNYVRKENGNRSLNRDIKKTPMGPFSVSASLKNIKGKSLNINSTTLDIQHMMSIPGFIPRNPQDEMVETLSQIKDSLNNFCIETTMLGNEARTFIPEPNCNKREEPGLITRFFQKVRRMLNRPGP